MGHNIQHELFFQGDFRALAQAITLVENDAEGCDEFLKSLPPTSATIVGITGPPGAGKSTLISKLLPFLLKDFSKVAVISVDPTSPFTHGALLGDRLRMYDLYDNPNVFIRSMATRGSLGGLSAKTYEVADVISGAGFPLIIIETVGVGQSEVEIASLADVTIVVTVPESGDEIQVLKSGIMEIADIFVLNKSDRDGADNLVASLSKMMHTYHLAKWVPPVIKTIATQSHGIQELAGQIKEYLEKGLKKEYDHLLAERAVRIISQKKLKQIDFNKLKNELKEELESGKFNLYKFIEKYI